MRRYLLYAIGEIILVVIGILLALYINNLNEERQIDRKIQSILAEVKKDLLEDVKRSRSIMNTYREKNLSRWKILSGQFTEEDFYNRRFPSVIYTFNTMTQHQNGYNNLMRFMDNMPDKYAPLIELLNKIYVNNGATLSVFSDRLKETVYENLDDLAQNKDWYLEWQLFETTDDMVAYYIHDKQFKNQVVHYMNDLVNLFIAVNINLIDAIDAYTLLEELTGSDEPMPEVINYTYPDTVFTRELAGVYVQESKVEGFPDTLFISLKDGRLLGGPAGSGISAPARPVYWFRDDLFFLGGDAPFYQIAVEGGATTISSHYSRGQVVWTKQ